MSKGYSQGWRVQTLGHADRGNLFSATLPRKSIPAIAGTTVTDSKNAEARASIA
jgi:hypothetical protein